MRARSLAVVVVCTAWLSSSRGAVVLADTRSAVVTIRVEIHERISLQVSTSELRFAVTPARAASPPTATIEFSAGARTRGGGEVFLTVEPMGPLEGSHGAADVESEIEVAGDATGTVAGVISAEGPQVAARWIGGGLRTGRLTFMLRVLVNPGTYILPVRFVLSIP
jgi:hypothetical protein